MANDVVVRCEACQVATEHSEFGCEGKLRRVSMKSRSVSHAWLNHVCRLILCDVCELSAILCELQHSSSPLGSETAFLDAMSRRDEDDRRSSRGSAAEERGASSRRSSRVYVLTVRQMMQPVWLWQVKWNRSFAVLTWPFGIHRTVLDLSKLEKQA